MPDTAQIDAENREMLDLLIALPDSEKINAILGLLVQVLGDLAEISGITVAHSIILGRILKEGRPDA
jgi:hypothetical protein